MRMLDLVLAPGKLATQTKLDHYPFHYLATSFLNIYPRQQMCMSPETGRRMFQEQSCTQSKSPERADKEAWRAQFRLHSFCVKSSGSIFCTPHAQSFNFLLFEFVGVGSLLPLCGFQRWSSGHWAANTFRHSAILLTLFGL